MKIARERTEILLMEYATGSLDEASALLISSYICLCPEARHFMTQCEKLGGALVEHCCEPVAMSARSMKSVLERLDDQSSPSAAAPPPCPKTLLDACCEGRKWRRSVPGILHKTVKNTGPRYKTALVKMAPGAKIPSHLHDGIEITLVLEGSFHDENGAYTAGDLIFIGEEEPSAPQIPPHSPIAGKEGCLCLVLSEKPVRFTGPFALLLDALARNAGR